MWFLAIEIPDAFCHWGSWGRRGGRASSLPLSLFPHSQGSLDPCALVGWDGVLVWEGALWRL